MVTGESSLHEEKYVAPIVLPNGMVVPGYNPDGGYAGSASWMFTTEVGGYGTFTFTATWVDAAGRRGSAATTPPPPALLFLRIDSTATADFSPVTLDVHANARATVADAFSTPATGALVGGNPETYVIRSQGSKLRCYDGSSGVVTIGPLRHEMVAAIANTFNATPVNLSTGGWSNVVEDPRDVTIGFGTTYHAEPDLDSMGNQRMGERDGYRYALLKPVADKRTGNVMPVTLGIPVSTNPFNVFQLMAQATITNSGATASTPEKYSWTLGDFIPHYDEPYSGTYPGPGGPVQQSRKVSVNAPYSYIPVGGKEAVYVPGDTGQTRTLRLDWTFNPAADAQAAAVVRLFAQNINTVRYRRINAEHLLDAQGRPTPFGGPVAYDIENAVGGWVPASVRSSSAQLCPDSFMADLVLSESFIATAVSLACLAAQPELAA